MAKRKYKDFREYYMDDNNVPPDMRAKIEFEVELIGKLIEARESLGLTQSKLAEETGLKQSAIARLEGMKSTPRVDTLINLLTPMGYRLAIVPIDSEESEAPVLTARESQ